MQSYKCKVDNILILLLFIVLKLCLPFHFEKIFLRNKSFSFQTFPGAHIILYYSREVIKSKTFDK